MDYIYFQRKMKICATKVVSFQQNELLLPQQTRTDAPYCFLNTKIRHTIPFTVAFGFIHFTESFYSFFPPRLFVLMTR
jgi:hypothetical protein